MIYLITGGAGFVGSSIAIYLKTKYSKSKVISLDNLKRRGSEINLKRLRQHGVEFIHGDIRNKEDLLNIGKVDSIIECSAEPSILAGYYSSPEFMINTNLLGTVNCLEIARSFDASFIFLSTSRIYPFKTINSLNYFETETRFELTKDQNIYGCSNLGLTEDFPLMGLRSLYGATKLASELLILEYADMYQLKAVINRCGVIAGPWQFGKIDQGFVVLWVAKHFWQKELSYIGFGGKGKQVRDILHINDLLGLIDIELNNIEKLNGEIFNVGGGREISVSLKEVTHLCEKYTGKSISIKKVKKNRPADIKVYITDNKKVTEATGWVPKINVEKIVEEITDWIIKYKNELDGVLK